MLSSGKFGSYNPEALSVALANATASKKATSAKPKRKRPKFIRKVVCQVCGDVANDHIHYGAIACYSCRAFFRRGVNANAPYYCSQNKCCPITKQTRKHCQYCRFQRCLAVGMKGSWVMTEEDKREKKEKALLKKLEKLKKEDMKYGGLHVKALDSLPEDIGLASASASSKTNYSCRRGNEGTAQTASPHHRQPLHAPTTTSTTSHTQASHIGYYRQQQQRHQHHHHHHQSHSPGARSESGAISMTTATSPSLPPPPPPQSLAPPPPPPRPHSSSSPAMSSQSPAHTFVRDESIVSSSPASSPAPSMSETSSTRQRSVAAFSDDESTTSTSIVSCGSPIDFSSTSSTPSPPKMDVSFILENGNSSSILGSPPQSIMASTSSGIAEPTRQPVMAFTNEERQLVQKVVDTEIETTRAIPVNQELIMTLVKAARTGSVIPYNKLVEGYTICMKRIIKFASRLDFFQSFSHEDQRNLLLSNTDMVVNIRSARLLRPGNNLQVQLDHVVGGKNTCTALEPYRNPPGIEYTQVYQSPWACDEKHEKQFAMLMENIFNLEMNQTTTILMSLIVLFSANNVDLRDRHRCMRNQEFFTQMLYRYLCSTVGNSNARILLPKYMYLISQLEEMAQIMISKRLML